MLRPTPEEYQAFGTTPEAQPAEVKTQWRVHAARLHPDAGGDPEEFNRMRQLYNRIIEAARVCKVCGGTGRIMKQAGFNQLPMPCESCGGKGEFEI